MCMNSKQLDDLMCKFDWKFLVEEERSSTSMEQAAKDSLRIFHDVIKSVGKNCDAYASDVCYEVTGFPNAAARLDEEFTQMSEDEQMFWLAQPHAVRLIGVRKMGVDHSEYVQCRYDQKCIGEYLDLFLIVADVQNHSYGSTFRFRLCKAKKKEGKVIIRG